MQQEDNIAQLSVIGSTYQELAKVVNNFKSINWDLYWDLFLLKLLSEISFNSFYASFSLGLLEEFNFNHKQIGYMLSIHSIAMIVFNFINGIVTSMFYNSDTTGTNRISHALSLLIATFACLVFTHVWWLYCALVIPFSAVRVVTDSTFMEVLAVRTKKAAKGTVMGVFESLISVSRFTTPLITGFTIDFWGFRAPSTVAIILCFANLAIVNRKLKFKSKQN